ncbi:MAG TPA: general secretion pathway protein GspB [Noviherbaspirillum sp.]|jgi:general secretion pathway protein B|uniref:general secretion pathway protein GspB n=1 Tax=Noviherbaspirillum sp. TaxID=1926288 RepID=UPI002DDD089B|nr:general secretion pathway protein GspB [Noviherbaspirillum sp.]HEV2610655.1 general secretion pathway protein GspB [Noviherbaspirillum sp.]
MSYILDALKKAESERKLGGVPNIHAQPPASVLTPHQPSWRKPVLWAGLLALALTGGGLAWWQTSSRQAPPPVQVAQTPPPAVTVPQAPQAAAPPAAPEQPAVKPEPPAAQPAPPEAETIPETPKPAKPIKRAKPAETEQKAVAKAAPKQEPRVAKAAKPAPEPAAPKEERIASLRELPEHIQREIPPLVVNGYIYSPNKADRTVLVNGKLVREGDQVAPDLAVERLTQGGMVLNYKGYRYRSSY